MMAMLRDGALDAVIVGNDVPDDPALRTVFPDPGTAGERFRSRHGFVPVNHMLCARRDVMEHEPQVVVAIVEAIGKAVPKESLRPVLELAVRYAAEQGILARPLSVEEIWA